MGRFDEELKIKVSVVKLLEKLETNKTVHETNYNEAMKKFVDVSVKMLEERILDLKNGKIKDFNRTFNFNVPVPVSYVSTYNEVIGMLKFSTQEEIEITSSQYRSWVEDNWDWSHNFLSNTMSYNG